MRQGVKTAFGDKSVITMLLKTHALMTTNSVELSSNPPQYSIRLLTIGACANIIFWP